MQTAVEAVKPASPNTAVAQLDQPRRYFTHVGASAAARHDFEYPKLDEVVIDIADHTDVFTGSIKIEWIGLDDQYRVSVWNFSMSVVKHCTDLLDALAAPQMFRATVPMVCELLLSLGFKDVSPAVPMVGAA